MTTATATKSTFSVERRTGISADPSPGLSVKGGAGEWYYFANAGSVYQWTGSAVGGAWQWQGCASQAIPKGRNDIRKFLAVRIPAARFVFA